MRSNLRKFGVPLIHITAAFGFGYALKQFMISRQMKKRNVLLSKSCDQVLQHDSSLIELKRDPEAETKLTALDKKIDNYKIREKKRTDFMVSHERSSIWLPCGIALAGTATVIGIRRPIKFMQPKLPVSPSPTVPTSSAAPLWILGTVVPFGIGYFFVTQRNPKFKRVNSEIWEKRLQLTVDDYQRDKLSTVEVEKILDELAIESGLEN